MNYIKNMKYLKNLNFLIGIIFAWLNSGLCDSCKGCVELDELSFDKVIHKFPVSLVKFDIAFPFGEKHDEFEKFSKEAATSKELLIVQVGVKDYGERENEKLAKRYNIMKDNYPALLLFKQNEEDPIRYVDTEGFTIENIKRFVKTNSDVYLGMPGCLEEFDKLAVKFMTEKDNRKSLLQAAEEMTEKITQKNPLAKVYTTVMSRILEKGDDFVKTESNRVKGLLQAKLGSTKQQELSQKLNILATFANTFSKDEL